MSGVFITIEGIEGAGKSTQARLLADALENRGHAVTLTREPGGSDRLGQALRDLLKDPEVWRGLGLAEIYLYAAARAHHLESVVLPALARGEIVISDRFLDSTRAYQGYGRGRPLALIEAVHAHEPLAIAPARTLLLDLDPRLALTRARDRERAEHAGYDDESLAFFQRVREGFLAIATRDAARVRVIDAAQPSGAVHEAVKAALAGVIEP